MISDANGCLEVGESACMGLLLVVWKLLLAERWSNNNLETLILLTCFFIGF
jgi:hypothetical protein